MEGRTRADANSVRQRVHSIYCDNSCCEPFILGLALNAGRALHQGAAVLLHEVDRQRCSHLHHNRPVPHSSLLLMQTYLPLQVPDMSYKSSAYPCGALATDRSQGNHACDHCNNPQRAAVASIELKDAGEVMEHTTWPEEDVS